VGRDTYYDILGASPSSSQEEIRAKHRKLIQRIHPDLDGPVALFRQVQEAYEMLSDPLRRAAYDRSIEVLGRTPSRSSQTASTWESGSQRPPWRHSDSGGERPRATPCSTSSYRHTHALGDDWIRAFVREHPARAAAITGSGLLAFGAALGPLGAGVLLLGVVVLIIASVAGLGRRGAREREAYHLSGMAAVDAMSGRQFKLLLEYLFATKGSRVIRLGASGDLGADLLISHPEGRTIVQVKRWTGVVRDDAVQRAVLAKARYGVARALVVTSSNYSQDAIRAALSNGVTLWNREALAAELSAFHRDSLQSGIKRFSSDLKDGSRICTGFLATLLVALFAAAARAPRHDVTRRLSSRP
jgi:Restriction endonuclease/DnaJ domain